MDIVDIVAERSYKTPLSNSTLLPLLLLSLTRQKHIPRTKTTFQYEYDYIIVGGGGAGCVVAARLSEIPSVNVLLLEAGREPPILSEVPGMGRYFVYSDLIWPFKSIPQKHTGRGLVNGQIGLSTAKMLGGSGSFNGMMYIRGNHKNYDDWAAQGAKGWNFSEVFPYFLKLEDNTDIELLLNGYHAAGGPMTFEYTRYQPEMKGAVRETATAMGYKFVDPNGATQTGFFDHQSFNRDNQRCSSLKAYLVPAENRPNLDIVTNALVTKILIQNGRATGVQFDYKGGRYEIQARKEVIVSAGALNTPKLLMLSGIGPREELQKFNIPVFSDLPVGKNLNDHAGLGLYFTVDKSIRPFEERLTDEASIYEYIYSRSGPLSLYECVSAALLRNMEIYPDFDFPNFQLYVVETPSLIIKNSGLKPEVYNQFVKPYENETIYACRIQQLQSKSRGTVTLNSSNPYDFPIIDSNFLEHHSDADSIIQGLKLCRILINSEPLRKLGAKEFDTLVPGCEHLAKYEDDYFQCLTRTILLSFHHFAGTAKMGDPKDITTVLDPELRVKNIEGLRVVDGSVMPQVTFGNLNIPIVMIAEKASDMIKQSLNGCDSSPVIERQQFQYDFGSLG